MPRRARIHLPGVPIHLVQRGHNRDACFFTDEDYLAYREWLGDALKKSGCALHAYVLMTTHVHLLLTPTSAEAVSQLVMSLGRRYVQYINKTYRRTGTLWDSRYGSQRKVAKGVRVNINLAHCLNQVLGALSCQQSACSTEYSSECMNNIRGQTTFFSWLFNVTPNE